MIETLWSLSAKEWDSWRSDPLTKKCLELIIYTSEKKYGEILKIEAEENFASLFADPIRQARFATLRGRIDGVRELLEMLKLEMPELNDQNDETENKR